MAKMTASELKKQVKKHNPESHFFDRETMKAFGDTMHNYGVGRAEIGIDDAFGGRARVSVWELYRRRPVKDGLKSSAFFTIDDFKLVKPRCVFMRWSGIID